MTFFRDLQWFLVVWLCLAAPAHAVTLDHSRAEMIVERTAARPGEPIEIALRITPQAGWHSYWKNPGDSGIATEIDWTLPPGYTAGPIQWPAPERIPYADTLVNYGYSGPVTLLSRIVPEGGANADGPVEIKAIANWLVCADICVPQTAEFTLTIPPTGGGNDALFREARAALPLPAPWTVTFDRQDDVLTMFVPMDAATRTMVARAEFFPDTPGRIPPAAKQNMVTGEAGLYLETQTTAKATQPAAPLSGVLVLTGRDGHREAFAVSAQRQPLPARRASLGWGMALAFAFAGGLILNLMPCVFPVLALKALHLLHGAHHKDEHRRRDALAYTGGVVTSFLALAGLMLALRAAGDQIGWGFQLQSPWVVGALSVLFAAMALNLLDVWHFGLSGAGIGQKLTEMHGPAGSFFTGVLAAVVASPCTAPLMAPALGVALVLPPVLALAVFAALGLGLAVPFLAIGFVPALARLLPRPGAWMAKFKKIMAAPLIATALWLGWVAWQQILPTRVSVAENGLTWQRFDAAKLEQLRKAGKPVFVNMTADWCITCLFNEQQTLSRSSVKSAFSSAGVTLMKGDWTKRDPAITQYLTGFGRSGVPLYVFYPAGGDPKVLPQVLTERDLIRAIQGETD